MSNDNEPQYLIQMQKVTSIGSGESISISTNLPQSTAREDLLAEVCKLAWVMDERLIVQNQKVLAITNATKAALNGLTEEQEVSH